MISSIQSSDLYECCLYHLNGFSIGCIEVIQEHKKEAVVFTFSGKNIKKLQLDYFNGTVTVNLLDFRKSYMHLTSLIGTAKKEARKQLASKQGGIQ